MKGRVYYERGEPVTVLLRGAWTRGQLRSVLICRADGTLVVRPFRGLRLIHPGADATGHERGQDHGTQAPQH